MGSDFAKSFRLDGKAALIGGVGRTNSRSFALSLAEAGASICLVARTSKVSRRLSDELRDMGAKAFPIEADLTRPDDVDRVVREMLGELGRIDILFNHVGAAGAARDVVDLSYEEWRDTFATNLDAMFLCTKAVRMS